MNLQHFFCLSGYGYLHDIIQNGQQMIVRIKAIMQDSFYNRHKKDDIWIDCEISDESQLLRLNDLLHSVREGAAVIITFRAEYKSFINAYSGQAPGDPSHIIALQGKLRTLDDCYISGELVENNPQIHVIA